MFPSGIHEDWNLMGAKVHHNSGAIILPFLWPLERAEGKLRTRGSYSYRVLGVSAESSENALKDSWLPSRPALRGHLHGLRYRRESGLR